MIKNNKQYYYKGYSILRDDGIYKVEIEDGMFSYRILRYEVKTLQQAKDKINSYNKKINDLYKN